MNIEYPKMIFKTRADTRIVNSPDEQKAALADGYGEYDNIGKNTQPKPETKKPETKKDKSPKASKK